MNSMVWYWYFSRRNCAPIVERYDIVQWKINSNVILLQENNCWERTSPAQKWLNNVNAYGGAGKQLNIASTHTHINVIIFFFHFVLLSIWFLSIRVNCRYSWTTTHYTIYCWHVDCIKFRFCPSKCTPSQFSDDIALLLYYPRCLRSISI